MAITIADAVARINANLSDRLKPETIHDLCRQTGHQWRDRLLNSATTIHVSQLQILNTNAACNHMARLANIDCTGGAYG
jgi:hypothetical protein